MHWLKWCGLVALLLGLGLMTAARPQAAETAPPPPENPAAQSAAAEKTPPAAEKAPAAAPASKPAAKPARKTKPLRSFRPSEEIHVDKEVDFPSDI